jgi:hypothetical protein
VPVPQKDARAALARLGLTCATSSLQPAGAAMTVGTFMQQSKSSQHALRMIEVVQRFGSYNAHQERMCRDGLQHFRGLIRLPSEPGRRSMSARTCLDLTVTPELAVRTPYLFQPAEDKKTLKQLQSRQRDQEFVTQYTRH